jgi:hypothetical protein
LSHHDQQASGDQNPTEHGRMLPSNMLLLILILPIVVTFSTPTPDFVNYRSKMSNCHNPAQIATTPAIRECNRLRPNGEVPGWSANREPCGC